MIINFFLRLSLLAIWLLSVSLGSAQTRVGPLFGNGMVLQREQAVSVWGQDTPGAAIKITTSWGADATGQTNGKGEWRLQIKTPRAGGPHSLRIAGSDVVSLTDVWSGEVWICSGQSNMEMPVRGFMGQPVIGSQKAIVTAGSDNVRVFTVERNASIQPVDAVGGEWVAAQPNSVGKMSAVAYFFGQRLARTLNVPVGLVVSSWGGSSAEAWTDRVSLETLGNFEAPLGIDPGSPQQVPTVLYNGMLHPLIGYGMRGVIWYQGEANVQRADDYTELMATMVGAWREQWGVGAFPFYYAQIAPFGYRNRGNSAFLRESQLQLMDVLENSGMAVLLDIGSEKFIHPPEKQPVGERLAYWALAETYGFKELEHAGPLYSGMTRGNGGELVLSFVHAPTGLSSFGQPLEGFTIAGEDRVFHPAEAKIEPKSAKLVVWSPAVADPVAVRYAFDNWVEASLFSVSGLPASSFRTDDWSE